MRFAEIPSWKKVPPSEVQDGLFFTYLNFFNNTSTIFFTLRIQMKYIDWVHNYNKLVGTLV